MKRTLALAVVLPIAAAAAEPPKRAPKSATTLSEFSLPQLLAGTAAPGDVVVTAWISKVVECGKCPRRAVCEPCGAMIAVAETEHPEAGAAILLPKCDVKPGRQYRIHLRLEAGYESQVARMGVDPRRWLVKTQRCERYTPIP